MGHHRLLLLLSGSYDTPKKYNSALLLYGYCTSLSLNLCTYSTELPLRSVIIAPPFPSSSTQFDNTSTTNTNRRREQGATREREFHSFHCYSTELLPVTSLTEAPILTFSSNPNHGPLY
jgi:hypothetical protein